MTLYDTRFGSPLGNSEQNKPTIGWFIAVPAYPRAHDD